MIRVLPRGVKRLLRPVVFAFRSRALSRVEPYVFVETHTERLFWKYLGVNRAEIRNVVIVGAWEGAEIVGLLRQYPLAQVVAFEPSEASYLILLRTFRGNPRVRCYQEALSDYCGEALFHDATLPGAGSLLPFAKDPASQTHNLGLRERGSFAVRVSTLDDHEGLRDIDQIDLLKIDVQGAEMRVIRGGRRCLARAAAVLVEVGCGGSAYVDAATYEEVDIALRESGLALCGLGLDPVTLDGNALYVRTSLRPASSEAREADVIRVSR